MDRRTGRVISIGRKAGGKKHGFRIVPVDGSRTQTFVVSYSIEGMDKEKTFGDRASMLSWTRAAPDFGATIGSIKRTIAETVTVEST